jgi:hypothetical protein
VRSSSPISDSFLRVDASTFTRHKESLGALPRHVSYKSPAREPPE